MQVLDTSTRVSDVFTENTEVGVKSSLGEILPLPEPTISTTIGSETNNTAREVVKEAQTQNQKLEETTGVKLAKKQFLLKLFGLGASSTVLGVAIIATIATGGLGIPLLALTGVATALATADAGCAYQHYRDKAKGGKGLEMKGDSIANAVYYLAKATGNFDGDSASAKTARKWGSSVSIVSRAVLALATLWTGFFQPTNVTGQAASAIGYLRAASGTLPQVANLAVATREAALQEIKGV